VTSRNSSSASAEEEFLEGRREFFGVFLKKGIDGNRMDKYN
jgi:hypothetical protein